MATGVLESTVQSYIRLAVNKLGWARLIRNNVGECKDEFGQYHKWGLGKGSPDLVGWVQTPAGIARVFCIEVKRPKGGRLSPEQIASLSAINKRGGAAAVCRSVEAALEFAERTRRGEIFTGIGPSFPDR